MNELEQNNQNGTAKIADEPVLGADNSFIIKIQKKNPKKNPKQYELTTVQDIFSILNNKNINKFMREFKKGMELGIALRELSKTLVEPIEGIEVDNNILKMPSFTWIDD